MTRRSRISSDAVTITTSKDYGQNGIKFITTPSDRLADAKAEPGTLVQTTTFAMPSEDLSIDDLRYYNTGVDYVRESGSYNTDNDGIDFSDIVYILTGGGATTLPMGWYIAKGTVKYTGTLTFDGFTNIILADGAKMTVGTATSPIAGTAIKADGNNVFIQGQNAGDGTLSVNGVDGITALGLTIYGGHIEANGSNYGIYAYDNEANSSVEILGGQVKATGNTKGIYVTAPYYAQITLGWSATSDHITASSYDVGADGSVYVARDKYLSYTDGTGANATTKTIGGINALDAATLSEIAGKTLFVAEVIATGGQEYVAAGGNNGEWTASGDTKFYAVTGAEYNIQTQTFEIVLTEVDGVPADGAVIVASASGGSLPANLTLSGTDAATGQTIEDNFKAIQDAALAASLADDTKPTVLFASGDGKKDVAGLIGEAITNLGLTGVTADDFLPFTLGANGFEAATVTGHPLDVGTPVLFILKLDILRMLRHPELFAGTSAGRRIVINIGETTGLKRPTPGPSLYGGEWYDLQGRRIAGQPTQKGVYLSNGQKIIVK